MSDNPSLIYGKQPVIEALQGENTLDRIFILKGAKSDELDFIKAEAKKQKVAVKLVPKEKLHRLTRGVHQGVIAFYSSTEVYELNDVLDQLIGEGKSPSILALDGITDVRNFGAIARTAYAMGIDAILLPNANSVSLSDDAMKSSAGALQHITICKCNNMLAAVKDAGLYGLQILVADGKGSSLPKDVDFKAPHILVMGSEDKGATPGILKIADHVVRIPMANTFDSLNVGVATAMLLYEKQVQLLN